MARPGVDTCAAIILSNSTSRISALPNPPVRRPNRKTEHLVDCPRSRVHVGFGPVSSLCALEGPINFCYAPFRVLRHKTVNDTKCRFCSREQNQRVHATYAHPRCGRSAEDGSSRVPLPSGRTPRPFAVRVPRGPHSTPPTVRAGPTPTVAGCSHATPERALAKGSQVAARNPSAPPIRPDPTRLRPRPDSPAYSVSPPHRQFRALRSRRLTTFQV